jgi:3-methyladenine DNA glycosylase/8-oxoguanine DNA glycosylase
MREPGLGLRSGSLSARRGPAVRVPGRAGAWAPAPPTAPPPSPAGALTRCWQPAFPLDLARTLGVHRRGRGDPAYQTDAAGAAWRTSLTPDGPGTLRVYVTPSATGPPGAASLTGASGPSGVIGASGLPGAVGVTGTDDLAGGRPVVHAMAWGPGAAWLLASLPALLGAEDDPAGFEPAHPLVGEMFRQHPGLRISRSGRAFEALVPAVLEQKVVGAEARRAWRLLLLRFGDPPPGPAPRGMRVCPPPRTWARIPSWEWHRAGVELVRARTIIGAARVAHRVEEITTMPSAEADRRLQALSGIGPWTSAEIRQRACGDPDAVSVGDYHLPSIVGWALIRQKVDDAGMLELLAPYAGHRHRAARLLVLSGMGPPRRGPRNAPRDYRRI